MVRLYKIVQEEVKRLFARCHALLHILVLVQFIQSEGKKCIKHDIQRMRSMFLLFRVNFGLMIRNPRNEIVLLLSIM